MRGGDEVTQEDETVVDADQGNSMSAASPFSHFGRLLHAG